MDLIIIIRSLVTSLVPRQSWGLSLKNSAKIKYKKQCPHFVKISSIYGTRSTFFSLVQDQHLCKLFCGLLDHCVVATSKATHYSIARVRIDWNVFKALIEHIVRTEQRKNNGHGEQLILFKNSWKCLMIEFFVRLLNLD